MKVLPEELIGPYLAEAERRGLLAPFYLEFVTGLRHGGGFLRLGASTGPLSFPVRNFSRGLWPTEAVFDGFLTIFIANIRFLCYYINNM